MSDIRKALPQRDESKPAEQQGVFRKFIVERTDGSSGPGGKHEHCENFVIDVDHDPYAGAALSAYADACEATHPELAKDMRERYAIAQPQAAQPEAPAELRGLDTATRVRFYEHDFYVLSNFSAFTLVWKGIRFDTSEAAYHFEKFADCDSALTYVQAIQYNIRTAPSAHEAFKIAEKNKAHRRPDWDDVKVGIMLDILRAKAAQHEYVRRKLLATGDRELVEDSWRDDFWGWGPNRNGKNMLGRLWMQVRAELRDTATPPTEPAPLSVEQCHRICAQVDAQQEATAGDYAVDFVRAVERAQGVAQPAPQSKAERVHILVNSGPFPGMSEAFDFYMGADCWTDPAYRPDASIWAEAWKAAKADSAEQPAPQDEPSRSQKMREAGFTPRDTRLTCDECGAKFTRQFAPLHECAPQAEPAEPAPNEVAWLIESTFTGSSITWWNGLPEGAGVSYTSDPNAAVRFHRKEDAERVAQHMHMVKVTEHVWI